MSDASPLKQHLASLLRHATTALLGLGGLLLSHDLIDPSDVVAVDAAGVSLQGALVVIVVAVVGRVSLTVLGKIFPGGPAKGTEPAGGRPLVVWIGLGMTAGLLGCALPSCTPAQVDAFRAVPIRFTLITPQGDVGYSSKSGLAVDYHTSK